jgi:hypothetical protein
MRMFEQEVAIEILNVRDKLSQLINYVSNSGDKEKAGQLALLARQLDNWTDYFFEIMPKACELQ